MNLRVFFVAGVLAVAATPTVAAPQYYVDATAFAAAATGLFNYESFENPVAVGGGRLYPHVTTNQLVGYSYPSDGRLDVGFFGSDLLTFTFDAPITAFGVDLLDLGTFGPTDFFIGTAHGEHQLFGNYENPVYGNTLFAGLVDADGFTSVTMRGTSFYDYMEVDLLRTIAWQPMSGAVPEPASWAMLIAGFGLVGATQRRRRVVGRAAVG